MRAKLTVSSVTNYGRSENVKFQAIYSDNKEDNSYAEATPSASAEFTITNPNLLGKLKPGQAYYVDFTPVDTAAACTN